MKTIAALAQDLAHGRRTSRDLIDESLERIADPAGEGSRAFVLVAAERARREADRVDSARKAGRPLPAFAGVPISVKDLFDIEGETTRAGSRVLASDPPKSGTAPAIARLQAAGFVIVGRTNMTEFAYGALGLNAHYGTPRPRFDRAAGRTPGGSSSGAAVGISDGMVAGAIGSDTGGSCRIPAAFCGVVGFKPTAARVPLEGAFPLAPSLDSVGPLTQTANDAAILDDVMSGGAGAGAGPKPLSGLRLGRVGGYAESIMDRDVADAFAAAIERLERAGAQIAPFPVPELERLPEINRLGGIVGAESFAIHRRRVEASSALYDPWVLSRLETCRAQPAYDYIEALGARQTMRAAIAARSGGFDALLMPTVQILPPRIDALGDVENSRKINFQILRNTAIANFLDRPAISLPLSAPGGAPVGLMLMGETGGDRVLLAAAAAVETALGAAVAGE